MTRLRNDKIMLQNGAKRKGKKGTDVKFRVNITQHINITQCVMPLATTPIMYLIPQSNQILSFSIQAFSCLHSSIPSISPARQTPILLRCEVKVLVTQLCPTLCNPWTVAHQAPLSMGFSRQEYWSGSLSFLQGIFPTNSRTQLSD